MFALGDVATIKLPNGKALPKAGVFAHSEARIVAHQLADKATGDTSHAAFEGKGYCWIELGDGRASFAGGDFYAELVRSPQGARSTTMGRLARARFGASHLASGPGTAFRALAMHRTQEVAGSNPASSIKESAPNRRGFLLRDRIAIAAIPNWASKLGIERDP